MSEPTPPTPRPPAELPAAVRPAPALLRPAVGMAGRLRTSVRLLVLVLVLLVPGVGATTAYSLTMGGQIAFTDKERSGVELLRPALLAMASAVSGQGRVDLTELDAAARQHPDLASSSIEGVRQQAGAGSPAERAELVSALVQLVTEVGNTSNLILDPDLDSFYVMDALVVQVPKALQSLSAAAAAAEATGSDARIAAQAVRAGTLSGAGTALQGDVETALANTTEESLNERTSGLLALTETVTRAADALTADLGKASPGTGAVAESARTAIGPATEGLATLLEARAADLSARRALTLTLTLLGLLVAGWFAAGVRWRTSRDVTSALVAVTALADGDRTQHPLPEGRDELGDLGRAVAVTRRRLVEQAEGLEAAQATREHDLRQRMQNQAAAEREVRDRAQGIVDATATSVGSELEAVIEQVTAVRQAAQTIEGRVRVTDTVTRDVVERAAEARTIVTSLGESLGEVTRMAEVIAGVADQTRLLALNATIEAARAGTAGRGFTVVANEVKELAATTGRSTVEITATVSRLRSQADEMGRSIAQIGEGIGSVDEATAVLSSVASEQHTVVERLDAGLDQAIARVQSMLSLTDKLERRHQARIPLSGQAQIERGSEHLTATLLDLGEGGMRCIVSGSARLSQGDVVGVQTQLAGQTLRLTGRVVHQAGSSSGQEVGLAFDDLPAQAATLIRQAQGAQRPHRG
ncbi:MAG: methyl-accepting chemotaxis protein [Kineosporiaceae bacterium]|nr:methyl-accepting chemotaxis protein [Kineosporiaceae bacterium]